MSVFGKILEKLGLNKHGDDGHAAGAPTGRTSTSAAPQAQRPAPSTAQAQQQTGAAASAQRQAGPTASTQGHGPASTAPATRQMSDVDVTAKLEKLAAESPQKLNWRTSIVDLMKLLGMESSLAERKELAAELGYPSDQMSDTAKMNIWLHKQVLVRIAQNGGNVPKELLN
jgi:hypothetical protein